MSTAVPQDRYELVERIGAGGMGEVYLARHLGIAGFRRNVALKRLLTSSDEHDHRGAQGHRIDGEPDR